MKLLIALLEVEILAVEERCIITTDLILNVVCLAKKAERIAFLRSKLISLL